MVLEHAILSVIPGQEAAFEKALHGAIPLIAASPGFRSLRVSRGIESPNQYVLAVEWDSVEAHTQGFRGSPAFQQWRDALHHFYDPAPIVEHFTTVAQA